MRSVPVTLASLLAVVWRPVTAGIVMYIIVRAVHPEMVTTPILRLLIDISVGILAYIIVVYTLWRASGTPEGVEHAIRGLFSARIAALKAKRDG